MEILKMILTVIFFLDCIVLTVIVLMQEGKQQGLGVIAGAADTYWGRNKGRSMEGGLIKATRILGALFFVLALEHEVLVRRETLLYEMQGCFSLFWNHISQVGLKMISFKKMRLGVISEKRKTGKKKKSSVESVAASTV